MSYYKQRRDALHRIKKLLKKGTSTSEICLDIGLSYGFSTISVEKMIEQLQKPDLEAKGGSKDGK